MDSLCLKSIRKYRNSLVGIVRRGAHYVKSAKGQNGKSAKGQDGKSAKGAVW